MDRRKFMAVSAALAARAGIGSKLTAQTEVTSKASAGPDLVAVKGGNPAQMFDRAITALGGIKAFVKPGQKIVVKPNIGWARTPEEAACTSPEIVGHIVKLCLKAGAKEVKVFDNTCNDWQQCYQRSGIEKAAKEAGAIMVPGNDESYYQKVEIPHGKVLKEVKVHKAWLEADAIINVPILKNHGGARMTSALKNLMGVVWDRRYYHRSDLHQCIADFATSSPKPVLNIIDAYNVMMRNGPRGTGIADVARKMMLIASRDMVAADTAASAILEIPSTDITYIKAATELGIGVSNLKNLKIERISI
ncbi:MAG: DUF362 domain-containing protein [Candidatus Rifleibacteriota bacterium]